MSMIPAVPDRDLPIESSGVGSNEPPRVSTAAGGGRSDITRILMAVYRFKWMVAAALVTGLGAGAVAVRFIEPQYQAYGNLMFEIRQPGAGSQGPIRSAEVLTAGSWLELLKMFTVLDYVVTDLKLYLTTRSPMDRAAFDLFALTDRSRPGSYRLEVDARGKGFTLSTIDGAQIQRGSVGDSVGGVVGFRWKPAEEVLLPGRVIEFTVQRPRDVAVGLRDQIVSGMTTNGTFLRLSLVGTEPTRVAQTVNGVMNRFVDVAADLKRAKLDELTEILDQQRQSSENNLKEAEAALESFRVQTITMPTGEGSPVAGGVRETRDPVMTNFFQMRDECRRLAPGPHGTRPRYE